MGKLILEIQGSHSDAYVLYFDTQSPVCPDVFTVSTTCTSVKPLANDVSFTHQPSNCYHSVLQCFSCILLAKRGHFSPCRNHGSIYSRPSSQNATHNGYIQHRTAHRRLSPPKSRAPRHSRRKASKCIQPAKQKHAERRSSGS